MLIRLFGPILPVLLFGAFVVYEQSYTVPLVQHTEYKALAEALCSQKMGEQPKREFRSDGCTLWPNAFDSDSDYGHCCIRHDMDYWCGGTKAERITSDNAFRECVKEKQPFAGRVSFYSSRLLGQPMLPTPWRWGWGHADYPRGYNSAIALTATGTQNK